jgi:RNA polymerase sigma-70 factor (ECF subfamily)
MATGALDGFRSTHARAITGIHRRGRADQWGLEETAVAATLHESVGAWARGRGAPPGDREVAEYLDGLNAEDLVLACACVAGITRAWEHFVAEYREMLQASARALIHDEVRARDLADSLYAELYGLEERDGVRRSLLAYFHGRSSLRTWLKAIVAQRFVDTYRARQRAEEFSEAAARALPEAGSAAAADPPEPGHAHYVEALAQAFARALAELEPRDRMRINFYYVEENTLKEIGRIMGEHESNVSRRLARSRKQLRRRIEQLLRRENRLSDEQIRLCYDYAVDASPVDLSRVLSGSIK